MICSLLLLTCRRGSHHHHDDIEGASKTPASSDGDSDDSDSDAEPEFPLFLSVPIVLFYLLFVSFIVSFFDFHDGNTPGLDYGDAFYFSFISLSTVGLGDVMPNNIEYSPMLAFLFLFGLALLSVVNSTLYQRLEGHFLACVDRLEGHLETVHYYRHGREGYWVFKELEPNIQLLALALPIFASEEEERRASEKLDMENTDLCKRRFPLDRKMRAMSMIEQPSSAYNAQSSGGASPRRVRKDSVLSNYRPTLGIWRSSVSPSTQSPTVQRKFSDMHPPTPRRQLSESGVGRTTRAMSIGVSFAEPLEEDEQREERKLRRKGKRRHTAKVFPIVVEEAEARDGRGREVTVRRVQSERVPRKQKVEERRESEEGRGEGKGDDSEEM